MLIIMKNRDVEFVPQPFLDFETTWCGNVLQIDSSKAWSQGFDDGNDFFGVCGVEADRPGINVCKLFEKHRFSFHHGHRGFGADISQTQYCSSIRDNRNRVAFDGQLICIFRIFMDFRAYSRDSRGVSNGQVITGTERESVIDFDFPLKVGQESPVGKIDEFYILNFP